MTTRELELAPEAEEGGGVEDSGAPDNSDVLREMFRCAKSMRDAPPARDRTGRLLTGRVGTCAPCAGCLMAITAGALTWPSSRGSRHCWG